MPGSAPNPDDIVRQAARAFDPDRYLAALLSPAPARGDLIVIAAVMGEIARVPRVPRVAREPRIAAIRLEWWYEALGGTAAPGNPAADAAVELIARRRLDTAPLLAAVDARVALLEPEPFASEAAAWEIAGATEAGGFRAAAAILGAPADAATGRAIALAGEAFAMTRRLLAEASGAAPARALPPAPPGHWTEGIRRRRDEVRARLASAPRGLHDALRPLALIEPYLRALEGAAGRARAAPEITPLARAWCLWRARLVGRI